MQLAGLWVSSDAKAGRDAAELAGLDEPTGVIATTDADALLAMDADAVCYTATGDLRPVEAIEDLTKILAAGKNVVSSSLVPLVHPAGALEAFTAPLEDACKKGGTSFFTSGIDPGFANDVLPLLLTGVAEHIESVRVQEVLNYATYDQPEVLFETMGFGKAMDHVPILLAPGVLSLAWGGTVRLLADGLGVTLDEIRETFERREATETFTTKPGTVEKGTMAGLRFEVQGIVGGRARIVVEHVTRMHDAIAPDWPAPPSKGGYRVIIEGSPRMVCEFTLEGDGGDENSGGLIVTAMRLVNAIPAVCAAPPGLLSVLDLPAITGRGLLA